MKHYYPMVIMVLTTTSCATLNDSLKLGATLGLATGATGTFGGYAGSGRRASEERVALGAGIGMGVGLLASYLIHKDGEERRTSEQVSRTEMHFGDLPPSPFIMPTQASPKKGGR